MSNASILMQNLSNTKISYICSENSKSYFIHLFLPGSSFVGIHTPAT